MARQKIPQKTDGGTTRRKFIGGALGAAAAASALPALALEAPAEETGRLAPVEAWYRRNLDAIVRAWEPRFRFRQYRADEEDGGDWEEREAPRGELQGALERRFGLASDVRSCLLILAVSPRQDDVTDGSSSDVRYDAAMAMALDALDRAEELGYFARPCPEEFRFPDLPALKIGDTFDDLADTEARVRDRTMVVRMLERLEPGERTPYDLWDVRAELAEARARLEGMRSGAIPALTSEEKEAAHHARLVEIVAAYRERLEAAGIDASWVELPVAPE